MFAYYRTSCHNTVNQKILKGSIVDSGSSDLVLVKGNSLEWLTIGSVAESDPNLLTRQLQQSTFGIILDAQILSCTFDESIDEQLSTDMVPEIEEDETYPEKNYSRKIRQHSPIQGQDVLVALSEYGKLVFMTIHCGQDHKVKRFEMLSEVFLDKPGLEYTKIGKKLAVDPYSRAIAIGSFQDNFDVFILKESMSRIKFDPIIGRGSEQEEGVIWHMEFLYTETTSMDRILLALVIYNDIERLCRLVIYEINASNLEDVTIEKIGRLPLEKNTPLPLLLIPLKFQAEAFILVTEQQVCLLTADDLTCGNVLYPTTMIPRQFGSTECPLFTSFASHIDPEEEYVYLGSAEGYLYKLVVLVTGETRWIPIEQTNPISQSMCMLGSINMIEKDGKDSITKADIVLYAGESSDSQVLAITCRRSPSELVIKHTVLQALTNRAPLTDFQVAENFRDHQDALIACSGQDKHGAISIIIHGIETTGLHASKPEWNGVYRLWNLTATSSFHDVSCLVASSILDTRLLCAEDGHIKDITATSRIEFDTETIHANTIQVDNYKLLLQIYSSGLSIIDIGSQGSESILTQWKPEEDSDNYRIELATSWHSNERYYIAICIMKQNLCTLQVLSVEGRSKDDTSSSFSLLIKQIASLALSTCPNYIGQFNIRSQPVLAIGTFSPSLQFYSIKSNSLCIIQDVDLSHLAPGQFTVPHSAAIIHSTIDEPLYFLVGLRQGSMLSFKMGLDNSDVIILDKRPHLHNVGSRAVRLSPLYQSKSAIYASSEELWRMTCSETNQLEMEHILLPKFSKSIDAFAPFDCDLPLLHTTGEPLAVVADNKLQIFQLGFNSQTNTYKISLGETPKKVIYDKALGYIIVITTSTESGERKNYLQLLDPSSGKPLTDKQLLGTDTDYGRSDMILSAAEWSVENNGKIYKYLCIGIGHPKEPFHSFRSGMSARVSETLMNKGTLQLFRLKAKPNKSSGFSLSRVWDQDNLPGGVFAIRPHSAGLLFSAGRNLYLYRLVKGRLVEVAQTSLRFTVTSIHEDGDRICVGSHTDSLSFYQFDPETSTLEFLKSDVSKRSIHHSLMLNSRLAVGVTQSGGMVALYDDPNDKSFEDRMKCLFSFHYPDIIVKPSLALLRSQHDSDYDADLLTQHLLPWSQEVGTDHQTNTTSSATSSVNIVACTVSGGIIHVYRISPALYSLLNALQDILIDFGPTSPLLGSPENFKDWFCQLSGREKAVIHGDLVELYLRLSEEEQLAVIQNEDGAIKPELLEAIKLLTPDHLMEVEHDEGKNHVCYIKDILSGFERYR